MGYENWIKRVYTNSKKDLRDSMQVDHSKLETKLDDLRL